MTFHGQTALACLRTTPVQMTVVILFDHLFCRKIQTDL